MAPHRQLAPEPPASSSSTEQEYHGSSSSSEDSEDQDKTSRPTLPKVKRRSSSKNSKPHPHPQSSSSDGSDSGSDSASDSEETIVRGIPESSVKPISAKSTEEPSKAKKKSRSKPSATASEAPAKASSAGKRSSENQSNRDAKDAKKAKKVVSDPENGVTEEDAAKKTGDDSKKQLFQRLWSLDDEIATLKGIIEYVAQNGSDPVADMVAFHEFMKNKLQIDVTKSQLSDKVRRFKKKYVNNASKGKNGEDRTFSNAHEQKAFDLSKKIWGTEANCIGLDTHKSSPIAKKNKNKAETSLKLDPPVSRSRQNEATKMEVHQNDKNPSAPLFNRSNGDANLDDGIVKEGLELIKGTQRSELEAKWKGLRIEEVELFLKKVELIREQTIIALEVLKSSGN